MRSLSSTPLTSQSNIQPKLQFFFGGYKDYQVLGMPYAGNEVFLFIVVGS